MTIEQLYERIGGDYKSVLGRFMSDKIVDKFVIKYLNDSSYDLLKSGMEEPNYEEAFRAAHTMKGVCQNLSFDRLCKASEDMTEALRNGPHGNYEELYQKVTEVYNDTVAAIREYEQSK